MKHFSHSFTPGKPIAKHMARLTVVSAMIVVAGCADLPIGSFMPYTTAEGRNGWRYGARGLTPDQIDAGISEGIAQNKICPSGWKVVTTRPGGEGLTLYEGECR